MDEKYLEAHVVWADRTHDSQRICEICDTNTCIKPVHSEQYKTKSDKLAAKWDRDNPVI
jgi:hypothetical protein